MRGFLAVALALTAGDAIGIGHLPLESDDMVSLLQTRADLRGKSGQTHNASEQCGYLVGGLPDFLSMGGNNGRVHSHGADFSKSLVQVMAEHPGVDGYCYFNDAAIYIQYVPDPRDYVAESRGGVEGLAQTSPLTANAPESTYRWEGPPVKTRVLRMHYVYDDLYGYSLGFLQGQGIDTALIFNSTAWEELSAQKCSEIQQEYQFRDDELVFNDLLDHNLPILVESCCAAGIPPDAVLLAPGVKKGSGYNGPDDCRPPTRREFALHHYMKCVLGHKNSAADMAYVHTRACLLEGGRIGHEEECPFNLMA